jgi:cyclophilin family peptidyl-prolyl cis-trans isomerase/HEAT repeat protein
VSSRVHALVLALVLLAPAALVAQESGSTADLAQLLALEDRKVFDAALLQRAAQHPDSLVRRYAAMVMGRIGDASAEPLLRALLADRDSAVRVEAAFACGTLGSRQLVPDLVQLVERFPQTATGDFEVEIVTALAKLGGAEAEAALDGVLDRHPASREQADRATTTVLIEAWRLGRRSALARRLPGYIRDSRADWRKNAAYSASRIRLATAAAPLLDAASDDDPMTRSYAARALTAQAADSAGISRGTFLSRLRALVDDTSPPVRINALRSLGTFEDSSLVPIAAARLTDRNPNVPVQAAQTLGSLKGSQASATLVERFPSAPSFGQRRAMLLALAAISPSVAIETGRAWRADADWRNRAAYAEMLGVAKSAAARQQLTGMLTDADQRVAGFALGALEQMVPRGDTELLALARAALASPDVVVRATAIGVLGREKNPAMIRDLVAAFRKGESDGLGDARLAAVRALADIADSAPGERPGIEQALLASLPRPEDYIVRRLAVERFGEPAVRRTWGPALPVETGRTPQDYREIARRYVLAAAPAGTVSIELERGTVVILLYGFDAPLTVDNFLRLAGRRFFDNGHWHRVVPNFVVQDGDPRGDGNGGPTTVIRDEINRRRYDAGTVGMALSGPDTGGSQFFITHSPQPHLDGGYTVFGQVVSGWDVLNQVVQGDRIRRIYR